MVNVIANSTPAFVADDSTNCNYPFTVNFTNKTINGNSYKWDFGDQTTSSQINPSHTYNSYGNFEVRLIVTNANGCTDTLRKNLPAIGCEGFTKKFTNTVTTPKPIVSYLWDFGDGTTSSTAIPTHTYTIAGVYNVQLIITTAAGCADTTLVKSAITILAKPVAKFKVSTTNSCAQDLITFTDESTGNVKKWLWDFGDNTTSSIQNPSHFFYDTGYHDIQLIVGNSGCYDTIKYDKYLYINAPIADYVDSFDCSKPLERRFTNHSIGADTWSWSFGDGSTSVLWNPIHTYANPGKYTIGISLHNNQTGCNYFQLPIDI